ncbi:MAG: MaoC/PaaZ C-terminal domain-containing protein, partial [Ahrensia sp.]|nr:MaoC/PaaZ C-terminal domain-containing protein [Ahrensia sp.]
ILARCPASLCGILLARSKNPSHQPASIGARLAQTGDRFEIHMERDAARKHGFGDRIAHGLLVLSIVDGLKNQTPAQFKARASLGWDWTFRAPVLAGDTIGGTITVHQKLETPKEDQGVLLLDFDINNQREETVQQGSNKLLVYR